MISKICEICGTEIRITTKRAERTKYCSDRCRSRASYLRRTNRPMSKATLFQRERNIGLTPEQRALLGTMSDTEVGLKIGLSDSVVRYWRRIYNIAPCFTTKPDKIIWTTEMESLLGTDYDHVVADVLGISTSSVRVRRLQLNIPFYTGPEG
jgi:hypothetical protein